MNHSPAVPMSHGYPPPIRSSGLPLPLGEGWGEGTRKPCLWLLRKAHGRRAGGPHPAFGHPLPEGEGLLAGRFSYGPSPQTNHGGLLPMNHSPAVPMSHGYPPPNGPPAPLSLWERVGVRACSTLSNTACSCCRTSWFQKRRIVMPLRARKSDRAVSCLWGVGLVVLSAVDFDRQSCFVAVEVQYERRTWVLPAKFETVEPSATQQSPES